jgi:hypothetical protein
MSEKKWVGIWLGSVIGFIFWLAIFESISNLLFIAGCVVVTIVMLWLNVKVADIQWDDDKPIATFYFNSASGLSPEDNLEAMDNALAGMKAVDTDEDMEAFAQHVESLLDHGWALVTQTKEDTQ